MRVSNSRNHQRRDFEAARFKVGFLVLTQFWHCCVAYIQGYLFKGNWFCPFSHLDYVDQQQTLNWRFKVTPFLIYQIFFKNFFYILVQLNKTNRIKNIHNFHRRGSVLTRKIDFMYLTLKQGGKIFCEDTVNVESHISLGRIFIPNFIDFKK